MVFNFWNISEEIDVPYGDEIDSKWGGSPPETALPQNLPLKVNSVMGSMLVGKTVTCTDLVGQLNMLMFFFLRILCMCNLHVSSFKLQIYIILSNNTAPIHSSQRMQTK